MAKSKREQKNRSGPGNKKIAAGYFTLEAALIIPGAVIILVLFIYLSFYQYDRCLLNTDAYIGCLRECREKQNYSKGLTLDYFSDEAEVTLNKKRYFMLGGLSTEVGKSGNKIYLEGQAEIFPKVFGGNEMVRERNWFFSFGAQAWKIDASYGVRRFRRLKWLAENLT